LYKDQEEFLSKEAFILSLHKDSSDEEINDEDVACQAISDLDVMATYKILKDLQQQFYQHRVPAATLALRM